MTSVDSAPAAVPTGNAFDKYGSTNPVVRRLMARFERRLDWMFERAAPRSVLDVGCGEGVVTYRWAERLGEKPVLGIDFADPKLEAQWRTRRRENLEFRTMDVDDLTGFTDASFDLTAAIEVLEHVPDPDRTLAQMARIANRHVLVSVPREPLWRALNVARGAYLRELGNTPGHVNHFSRRGFVRLARRHGEVVEVRSPVPWTMLLIRVDH